MTQRQPIGSTTRILTFLSGDGGTAPRNSPEAFAICRAFRERQKSAPSSDPIFRLSRRPKRTKPERISGTIERGR